MPRVLQERSILLFEQEEGGWGRAGQSRRKKNMVIAVAVKRPEGRGLG